MSPVLESYLSLNAPFPKLVCACPSTEADDPYKSTLPHPTHTMTEFFKITMEPTIALSPTIETVFVLGVGSSKSRNVDEGNDTANGITGTCGVSRTSTLDNRLSDSGKDAMVVNVDFVNGKVPP
jgi:hypothetical protein